MINLGDLKKVHFFTGEDEKKFAEEIFKNYEYLFTRIEKEKEYLTSLSVKVKYGYCSHCRNEFKIDNNIVHNDITICPLCGAKLQVKEVRYGKKKLFNEACFYWFEKSIDDPNVIICKGYYVSKDYEPDYKNPKYDYTLEAIYIFDTNNKESKMFKWDWYRGTWNKRASIFDFNQGWLINKLCHCSFESLNSAVEGTIFQYSNYKKYCGTKSIIKYLEKFNSNPWIEQLEKIGFEKITETWIWKDDFMLNCVNHKGKNIFKKLRLNKRDVKDIRESKIEINTRLLRLYQLDKRNKSDTNILKVKKFDEISSSYLDEITILELTSIDKALKYVDNQFNKFNANHYRNESSVIYTWRDYIMDCKKLNRDLTNKNILFPKNLHRAHQDTIKLITARRNKPLDEKIKSRIEKLRDMYLFKDENFFIRPAESTQDLIKEGDTLNHCVAKNYSTSYADGICDILFLRRIDLPNKPLVTIEVRDGKLIQARSKGNENPGEEEQQFICKFQNIVLSNINKKKGKVA